MQVKFIQESSLWLNKGEIYKVFSIEISNIWTKTLYIKWESNYIYPFDISNFEIIDNAIPSFWKIGYNNFSDLIIWPQEIFSLENFWESYYNDNDIDKYNDIISKDYY